MAKILAQFGPNQKSEFTHPSARLIIRCPYNGCGKPINSHGIDRFVAAHFRAAHKDLPDPIIALIQKVCGAALTSHLIPARLGFMTGNKEAGKSIQRSQSIPETVQSEDKPTEQQEDQAHIHNDDKDSFGSLDMEMDSPQLNVLRVQEQNTYCPQLENQANLSVPPMAPRLHTSNRTACGEGSSNDQQQPTMESHHAEWLGWNPSKERESGNRKNTDREDEDALTGTQ